MASKSVHSTDDWDGIRYVGWVTLGWLTATALAIVLLMTVVPRLV